MMPNQSIDPIDQQSVSQSIRPLISQSVKQAMIHPSIHPWLCRSHLSALAGEDKYSSPEPLRKYIT